jgi:pimeloyl-ACP methyl ester carboxylesterase
MLLAFDDVGPGPVVVLLHGFPFDRSMWAGQTEAIGDLYRVIAPDLRGHGETAAPEGIYTMDAMADDVMELLDALQLHEPVVLGGLSMGGYIALSAVLRYPARFRGLMLFDTRATADTPEAAKAREQLARRVEETGSVVEVIEGLVQKLFSPLTRSQHAERMEIILDVMNRMVPRAAASALRGMAARPDRTAALAQITVPTLVIVGEDDVVTPPADARQLAAGLPDARLIVIPNAGHVSPVERPDEVNRAILGFLGDLP